MHIFGCVGYGHVGVFVTEGPDLNPTVRHCLNPLLKHANVAVLFIISYVIFMGTTQASTQASSGTPILLDTYSEASLRIGHHYSSVGSVCMCVCVCKVMIA